jgi:hypothetical protein
LYTPFPQIQKIAHLTQEIIDPTPLNNKERHINVIILHNIERVRLKATDTPLYIAREEGRGLKYN